MLVREQRSEGSPPRCLHLPSYCNYGKGCHCGGGIDVTVEGEWMSLWRGKGCHCGDIDVTVEEQARWGWGEGEGVDVRREGGRERKYSLSECGA